MLTACSISSLDVVGRVMLEPDDGGPLHANAVLAQLARELPRVGALQLACSATCGDSSPIHTQETPSSTSSCMVYLRIALADANTDIAQLLLCCFHPLEQFAARASDAAENSRPS